MGSFYMQLGYCMQNKISESEVSKRKLLALIGGGDSSPMRGGIFKVFGG